MTSDPHARLNNRIDLVIEKIRCNGQTKYTTTSLRNLVTWE